MALTPGLYKVKIRKAFHLLRIRAANNKLWYSLDNHPEQPVERLVDAEGHVEVIEKVSENSIRYHDIRKARIHISWEDHENRKFEIAVSDVWALRGIFYAFPFLQNAFQYKPRKK